MTAHHISCGLHLTIVCASHTRKPKLVVGSVCAMQETPAERSIADLHCFLSLCVLVFCRSRLQAHITEYPHPSRQKYYKHSTILTFLTAITQYSQTPTHSKPSCQPGHLRIIQNWRSCTSRRTLVDDPKGREPLNRKQRCMYSKAITRNHKAHAPRLPQDS